MTANQPVPAPGSQASAGGIFTREDDRLVIERCQELVRISSLPGQEGPAADWALSEMQRLGFKEVQRDPAGNVSGVWSGAHPGPTLLFDSHLDVVPADQPEQWSQPPFSGQVSDGRLWGRGAADTKGSLAAMLTAVAGLPRAGLHGQVIVLASVHEEILTGAAVLLALEAFQPDLFITGEPTRLALATAQKGRATFDLLAQGRSAHTSHPEEGRNAVYLLMEAIDRLRQAPKQSDPQLGAEIIELTEIISQPFPNNSLVPQGGRARFVARLLPGETWDGYQQRLQGQLTDLEDVRIQAARLKATCYTGLELEVEDFLPGWRCPADSPWLARILTGLRSAGLPDQTFAAGFGTNASAAAQVGIPCFIYGPGSLEQAHVVDEWVALEQLLQAVRGFRAIALACLGPR
jgi:putative selenium metabolism hydrolase